MIRYWIIAIVTFPISFICGFGVSYLLGIEKPYIWVGLTFFILIITIIIALKITDKQIKEKNTNEEFIFYSEEEEQCYLISYKKHDQEELDNKNIYWSDEENRFIIEEKQNNQVDRI